MKLDAPVAGTVASIKVKEGQTVKAGQILLELESDITRTELQQAQAKLEGLQNRGNMLELVKNQLQSEQLAQLDQIWQRLNSSKKAYALEKTAYIWLRKICNAIVIFGNRVLFPNRN